MPGIPNETPSAGLKYQPQLSGLRFCAVLFVVAYHFSYRLTNLKYYYDLGSFIVFFFVLSSYLITRILLNAKQKAIGTGLSRGKVAGAFLIRRTLRIFPAYYVYLLILLLLPLEGYEVRQHPGIFFSYFSNVWLYITKSWGPFTVHLWTLAVEEQFYVLCPWLLLFIPDRHLPKAFGTLIIIGAAFRYISYARMTDPNTEVFPMLVLLPACIDCFAAGALLAYYHNWGYTQARWLQWIWVAVIPIWFLLILGHHGSLFLALDRIFISLFAVTIIDTANRGYKGLVRLFLENRIIQYLSMISYGIYLYHLLMPALFWKFLGWLQTNFTGMNLSKISSLMDSGFISFPVSMIMAVGCATISWYCLEQPIDRLRKRIFYVKPATRIKEKPVKLPEQIERPE
ncbi:MAG TPA: acyltransferase [Puia sp.]|nr:acyltransferase [Puia sp.]